MSVGPSRKSQVERVRVAISMGDAAGIGPEVALKALRDRRVRAAVEPILVGDPEVWQATARKFGVPLDMRRTRFIESSKVPARWRQPGGRISPERAAACGDAAYRAILAAVRLIGSGEAQALTTAPISKAHLVAAGHDHPGHTELLAELAGNVPVRMMLAGPHLRVVLVTIHIALAEVPKRITTDLVLETIRITQAAMKRQFRLARPRLAVAGLNPHAGENGLFGREEIDTIAPAVQLARRARIHVVGPLAADGMFALAAQGNFDACVCMYHDQGLAPFKLVHFADGVNVTLGLPYRRTSPDHGTAFDIAGKGIADARSMAAALLLAAADRRPPG